MTIKLKKDNNEWTLRCEEEAIQLYPFLSNKQLQKINKNTNPKIIIAALYKTQKLTKPEKEMLERWR
ncbi:MAG: hypothetical protein QXD23_03605 [Candidatus Micrarchaeaceae archaeon]